MRIRPCFALLCLPLLGACVNDAASWQIDGREYALTLIREQSWFWDKTVNLYVVAARLPDCQRRHKLTPASVSQASVEVFVNGQNSFVLRQGGHLYALETKTCEGFQKLDKEPPDGLGAKAGVFRESGDKLRFIAEPPPLQPAPA